MQGQHQYAIGVHIAQLTVRSNHCNGGVIGPARTHSELANPLRRIGHAGGGLGGEAFVNVVVAVQNQIGVMVIQSLPESFGVVSLAAA